MQTYVYIYVVFSLLIFWINNTNKFPLLVNLARKHHILFQYWVDLTQTDSQGYFL